MKKSIIISTIVLIVAIAVGGYYWYKTNTPKNLGEIIWGLNVWPGNLPNLVAYDQGIYKKNGLDVKMIQEPDYGTLVTDFISGKINFADLALIDVVVKADDGEKIKIVLAADYSNGADGIVAKKEIRNIKELKGKKVAVEKDTLSEHLLYDALRKNELSLSDIVEVNLSAPKAAQAFIRGEVDAAATWEPDYTQAVEEGNGWRIYTSADSPGLIIDSLVFKSDYIKNNPEKVAAVVKSYFEGVDFIVANPEKAYEIGAKYSDITAEEFKIQYAGIKQMNKDDNTNAFFYRTTVDSLHGAIIQANKFLLEKRTIKTEVDSTEILDVSFVKGLN